MVSTANKASATLFLFACLAALIVLVSLDIATNHEVPSLPDCDPAQILNERFTCETPAQP